MTPTTVRMVLVEGEKADGSIVDHDTFDVTAIDGTATSASAAEQVADAILGTKESAAAGGHHLKSIGVTWSDHAEASTLRDTLAARGIDDVMFVSDGHAAGALAQAVGRAVGYATTALLFIDRDTATLSVVQTDDGSVVKVLSRSLHSDDAMAVLSDMAAAVAAQDSPPQGLFVVGSGVDVTSVKAHLASLVSMPVSAPEESELALARGAALASANAPAFEATTVGLAYSQDPDGTTAGNAYVGLAAAETQLAPASDGLVDYAAQTDIEPIPAEEGRKPFLLVGSALTSIFVVGVVALVISLAVSIRPTVDQRPNPGANAIVPSTVAPAPAPVQEAQQPVAPPPPAETIKPPVPVAVQEAPAPQQAPRQVYVEQAPAPQAPPPAPAAPPPAPAPEAPPPVPAPVAPAPVPYLPAPVYSPPVYNPYLPPPVYYPRPKPWTPPWSPPWQHPQEPQEPQDPPDDPPTHQNPPPWQWPGSGGGSGGSGSGGSGSGGSGSGGSSSGGSSSGGSSSGGSSEWPGSGGSGSGGSGESPRSGGSGGSGGGCFLIFCSPGSGRH